MDKNTLSNYGWIVIAVLVLSVMIALATPFGEYIKAGVESTTAGLFDTSEKALNIVGMSATGKEPPAPIVNVRDDYEHLSGYINNNGEIESDKKCNFVRIPVTEGEYWLVWYPDESKLYSGRLRYEDNSNQLVSYYNMHSSVMKYQIVKDTESTASIMQIPAGVSYMCVNISLAPAWDYTDSAIIAKVESPKWVALGDSITAPTATSEGLTKNYLEYVSEECDMSYINLAAGGQGYAYGDYDFVSKLDQIPNDVELITIYGSFNDSNNISNLGTVNDVYVDGGNNSVAAHINYTYDYIKTNHPNAKIAVIIPAPWFSMNPAESTGVTTSKKYVNLLKEICDNKGIAYLDLYNNSGMTPWDDEYKATYYLNGDGVHPNNEGHKLLAPKITPFIKSIIG